MSVESDFRALLANDAGVASLVGDRIALNAVAQGAALPLIVFTVAHEPTLGLDNTVLAEQCTITVECWATTAVAAGAVADAVASAVEDATPARGAVVISRASAFEPEQGLDGVALSVDWWA